MKLGHQRKDHKGREALRHYANQLVCRLYPLRWWPNCTPTQPGLTSVLVGALSMIGLYNFKLREGSFEALFYILLPFLVVSNICCLYRWCGTLRGCRARCRCCSCWGSPGRMTARCCAVSPTARPATPPWWPGHSWTSSVSGILSIYVLFWYKICTCWKRFSFLQCSSTNIPCGVDVFLSSSSSFVKIIESWCKVLLSSEPGQRSQREHYSHFCFAFVWPGVGIELERNLREDYAKFYYHDEGP